MDILEANAVEYPLYARPKLRGVYCRITNEIPVDIRGEPIKNRAIRDILSGLPPFEGRLMVGLPTAEDVDSDTQEVVSDPASMRKFSMWAYDVAVHRGMPLNQRLSLLGLWRNASGCNNLRLVPYKFIKTPEELLNYEAQNILAGHLGIVYSSPYAPYARPTQTTH